MSLNIRCRSVCRQSAMEGVDLGQPLPSLAAWSSRSPFRVRQPRCRCSLMSIPITLPITISLVQMGHDAGHRSDNNPLTKTRFDQATTDVSPHLDGRRPETRIRRSRPSSIPLMIPAREACRSSHSASPRRALTADSWRKNSPHQPRAVPRNSNVTSVIWTPTNPAFCSKTSSDALASTAGGPSRSASR